MNHYVGFVILSQTIYGALNCDRAEFIYQNMSLVQAAGICDTYGQRGSTMYTCESSTKMNANIYYFNRDCQGSPNEIHDITEAFTVQNITDYTITCCTGNPCQFANVSTYETDDCSDPSSGSYEYSTFSIIGSCYSGWGGSTQYASCSNNKFVSNYYHSHDCSGDAYENTTESTGDCDDYFGTRTGISCGYAINTCSSTQCVCKNYTASNASWISPDGNGCVYGCHDCTDNVCECYDKETCDAWNEIADLVSGLSTIIIVLIIAGSVCGLCIIGVIVYCVCAGALCCAAASRPRKGVVSFKQMTDNISPDPINLTETK